MTTTLTAVLASMETAIQAVSVESTTWKRVEGIEQPDDLSGPQSDKRFWIGVEESLVHSATFGIGATHSPVYDVRVVLFREIHGDSHDKLHGYQDELNAVANAIEKYASYPSGTDAVIVTERRRVSNDATWWRGEISVFVQYQATY